MSARVRGGHANGIQVTVHPALGPSCCSNDFPHTGHQTVTQVGGAAGVTPPPVLSPAGLDGASGALPSFRHRLVDRHHYRVSSSLARRAATSSREAKSSIRGWRLFGLDGPQLIFSRGPASNAISHQHRPTEAFAPRRWTRGRRRLPRPDNMLAAGLFAVLRSAT